MSLVEEVLMRFGGFGRRRRVAAAIAVIALAGIGSGVAFVGGATGAAATSTVLATFTAPGSIQTWQVPAGIKKVTFAVFGASGGNLASGQFLLAVGGPGGEATASFAVKPGETFEIVVGQAGHDGTLVPGSGAGGYPGGGHGSPNTQPGMPAGGGGGGASDVRLGGSGSLCGLNCGYGDRIVVAGGGGGAGAGTSGSTESLVSPNPTPGGAGGGLTGGPSVRQGDKRYGDGGSQEAGGACEGEPGGSSAFVEIGSFGAGADSTTSPVNPAGGGGGGGGGWYGGGGGCYGTGGGGGSGYASPFARKFSFPAQTNSGNGRVIISTP